MESKFKLPTETVELPSKGLLYPADSPLASGTIEMKYMTAREEDILTNQNYISNGTVIDKLLQSLIVTPNVDFNQILIGDKNAIMIAARVLAYGKEYEIMYNNEKIVVDLTTLTHKEVDFSKFENRTNEFSFSSNNTQLDLTFKLLTHGDERAIDREVQGLTKINKDNLTEVTTRLKYMITSVNGIRDKKDIREFVDNYFLARDARALRDEYGKINPDINMTFKYTFGNGVEEDVDLPIGLNFFWPDSGV